MTTTIREYDNRSKDDVIASLEARVEFLSREVKRLTGELRARERLSEAYRISGELRELLMESTYGLG